MPNRHRLPTIKDSGTHLYAEHCTIDQSDAGIRLHTQEENTPVPIAQLRTLLIGPGCSLTSKAAQKLAENEVTLLWVGEEGVRYYTAAYPTTRTTHLLEKQVQCYTNPEKHMQIVLKMYQLRFSEPFPKTVTLQQIRGMEGARVKKAYQQAAQAHGLPWTGRHYTPGQFDQGDPINKALTAGNTCLYGITHSAILSLGLSPALGFIHKGNHRSFVFDISDLYKMELVVPLAFQAAKDNPQNIEGHMRKQLRDTFKTTRFLSRLVRDILDLLDDTTPQQEHFDNNHNELWDETGTVPGGQQYGDDHRP